MKRKMPYFSDISNNRFPAPKNIFLIGGDFNLPDINWSEQAITNRQYPIKTNLAFLDGSGLHRSLNAG
jgi:hypothetical protein